MDWDSGLYDQKHAFVAEYGKELLSYVPDNLEQAILDVGCGSGTLTVQLAKLGARVVGVDSSEEMIARAKNILPEAEFCICNALNMPFTAEFDVIFSNAVFHWIKDHDALLKAIYRAMRDNGKLICEFGGSRNIAKIEAAFACAYAETGRDYHSEFNFPEVKTFSGLLEKNGFKIELIYDFDRPTPLSDGKMGLRNWLRQFFASELQVVSGAELEYILRRVEGLTRHELWNGHEWRADYRRLRAIACK